MCKFECLALELEVEDTKDKSNLINYFELIITII